jgi:hypothetical protein
MCERAEPAETKAKPTIVSKHNMANQLMRVIFMAFTSLRNLTLSTRGSVPTTHLDETSQQQRILRP